MPGVLILAGAGLVAAVKFHDAVLNADGIHVGGVPFAVIGLHFCEGLALILRRLLLEHRIELPIEQIRIHGLPHALPIRQVAIFDVFIVEYARLRLFSTSVSGLPCE